MIYNGLSKRINNFNYIFRIRAFGKIDCLWRPISFIYAEFLLSQANNKNQQLILYSQSLLLILILPATIYMVQRVTYRRRLSYNTQSNRVRKVKTPGTNLNYI